METYSLSGLTYTIPPATTGIIEFSGNSIPIQFTKGSGSVFSPDVLTLNSDNISSGRRKLGMLVYVYETNKIYQFRIDNYDTLWNNATGATGPGGSTVVISDFGTTVKNNSAAGIAFINAWTASTISGLDGYNDTNASWRVLSIGESNGGTFTGGTVSGETIFTGGLSANTISATTYLNLPIIPQDYLPLSGGTVTGATNFTGGLSANTISATTYENLPFSGTVVGSGTNNFINKFTPNSTSIGDSVMANNSNNVTIGSITTPYRFYVLGANATDGLPLLTVRDTGRVGIRTTNPVAELSVENTNSGTSQNILTLRNASTGVGTGNSIAFINSTTLNSTVGSKIESVNILSNGRNKLGFYVHGGGGSFGGLLERMWVDGTGTLSARTLSANTAFVEGITTSFSGFQFNYNDGINYGEFGTSNGFYSKLLFRSEDTSTDNFGYTQLVANPEEGFICVQTNGSGLSNSQFRTYNNVIESSVNTDDGGGYIQDIVTNTDTGVFTKTEKTALLITNSINTYGDDVNNYSRITQDYYGVTIEGHSGFAEENFGDIVIEASPEVGINLTNSLGVDFTTTRRQNLTTIRDKVNDDPSSEFTETEQTRNSFKILNQQYTDDGLFTIRYDINQVVIGDTGVSGSGTHILVNDNDTRINIFASDRVDITSPNININGTLTANTISATTYQGINRSFGVSFDGMGSVITVNSQSTITIPYNMVIQSWVLLSDVTGSTVIDIWKDTYANYPPTSGDTITASAKPTISSSNKNQSSTLTGWNTIVNSGDIIRFNVDSCTGITKAQLTIIGKEF
jgi:hypothetical protein